MGEGRAMLRLLGTRLAGPGGGATAPRDDDNCGQRLNCVIRIRAFRAAHDNVSPNSNVAMASSGRDSTVIVPDNLEEVRARLEARRKKQLERAIAARADYEKRMEEEKAAAAKRAEEAKSPQKNKADGKKEYPKPKPQGEMSPTKQQKQNGQGKGGSAPGVSAKIIAKNPAAAAPKASAIDANAKFLAAAAARAAAVDDGTTLEPNIGAGNARKPKANTPADPKSFDEIMAEKQAKPAEAADPNLKTKTMTVKSGDEELEIKYSVHVPEEAKKRLEERKRAREEAKGSPAPEDKAPAAESAKEPEPPAEEEKPKKKAKAAEAKEDAPDFSGMKVADLKKELVKRELAVNGLKAELIARLNEYEASRA